MDYELTISISKIHILVMKKHHIVCFKFCPVYELYDRECRTVSGYILNHMGEKHGNSGQRGLRGVMDHVVRERRVWVKPNEGNSCFLSLFKKIFKVVNSWIMISKNIFS